MDYKSFIQYVQQEIQNQYPDAEVIVNEVRKNNGKKLDSLVINENHERIVLRREWTPFGHFIGE